MIEVYIWNGKYGHASLAANIVKEEYYDESRTLKEIIEKSIPESVRQNKIDYLFEWPFKYETIKDSLPSSVVRKVEALDIKNGTQDRTEALSPVDKLMRPFRQLNQPVVLEDPKTVAAREILYDTWYAARKEAEEDLLNRICDRVYLSFHPHELNIVREATIGTMAYTPGSYQEDVTRSGHANHDFQIYNLNPLPIFNMWREVKIQDQPYHVIGYNCSTLVAKALLKSLEDTEVELDKESMESLERIKGGDNPFKMVKHAVVDAARNLFDSGLENYPFGKSKLEGLQASQYASAIKRLGSMTIPNDPYLNPKLATAVAIIVTVAKGFDSFVWNPDRVRDLAALLRSIVG